MVSEIPTKKIVIYHQYLGHINEYALKEISKLGINILIKILHIFLYKIYLANKQHKNSFFKDKTLHASKPLELIYINVYDFIQTKSIKRFTYFSI